MYKPVWDGPIAGYATNYIAKHAWRMPRYMDHDDLMQEARLVFLRCAARYEVEEARHFMALFKKALFTEITDLSVKASKCRAEVSSTVEDDDSSWVQREVVGETANAGELVLALRAMPSEVATVVSLFLNAPQELLELAGTAWNSRCRSSKARAGTNAHINKMLGLPEGSDPVGAVKEYFTP